MSTTNILIAIGALIYVVCPFDFDFVPVLGWVDDAVVAYMAWRHISAPAPLAKPDGTCLDAEFVVRKD